GAPVEPVERVDDAAAHRRSQTFPADGGFINERAVPARGETVEPAEAVALNFENADVREVVRVVLGEGLSENYVIDPRVTGQITLRTSEPLDRAGLLTLLETVLQVNGAALIRADGLYRIVPVAGAFQSAGAVSLGSRPIDAGFQARVVPLRFVAADQMARIVQPFLTNASAIQVDRDRNLLILAGNSIALAQVDELVALFDVEMFRGMSTGIFPVQYVDVVTAANEIGSILASVEGAPVNDMVRLVPMERLNALLVVTPQRRYLDVVKGWLERLDVPGDGAGRHLYVYRVQNVRATDLAGLLQQLFASSPRSETAAVPMLAPGATPRIIRTSPEQTDAELDSAVEAVGVIGDAPPRAAGEPSSVGTTVTGDAAPTGDVSIVADSNSNSLAILASPADYGKVESAIRQLDVMPRQVLLETTIVEVSLSGELSYGLQWFFDDTLSDRRTGSGTVGLPLSFPGTFSYSIVNAANELRAIFRVLATEGRIQVISSPSVVVLDNQTANIRVGNQQPVSTAILTEGGVVSTSVQFKDTGVTLDVTPRVNAGGLVTLDITQELTDVGQIDDATGQRAFLQRSIGSSVALHSGQSIVLGGLIRDNEIRSRSGVPFLHRAPIIGWLFGQKIDTQDRTELLIFINATVIENPDQTQRIVDELKSKMPEVFAVPLGGRPSTGTVR
ncbi:MAG TPA: type II secretion system secretin GspD, partial [Gammaproteobacteria bacterium]|nr:type II secretion system secretin GspD [Gammaproteobacteria bacterium]